MLIGKSLHISWSELACKDMLKTPYPEVFRLDGRVIELIVMFEKIRALYNKPIMINSAYRTPAYNKQINGSLNSQHCLGKALDLQPPDGVSVVEFHSLVRARADSFGIRGLGKYESFIHVDIRDSEKLVEW